VPITTGDEFVAVVNNKKATYLSLLSMIPMKAQLASTFGVITRKTNPNLMGFCSLGKVHRYEAFLPTESAFQCTLLVL
jgi:hypothetical protein